MAAPTIAAPISQSPSPSPPSSLNLIIRALANGLVVGASLLALAWLLENFLRPLIASGGVQENFTSALAHICYTLTPAIVIIWSSASLRPLRKRQFALSMVMVVIVSASIYGIIIALQSVSNTGAFAANLSMQFTLGETAGGSVVEAVEPGGAAEQSGLQVGDIIIALRRETLTRDQLLARIAAAQPEEAFRLRLLRDGEEMQLTARPVLVSNINTNLIINGLVMSVALGIIALVWPAGWTPYALLAMMLIPLLVGYFWLIIATFSQRTQGLVPIDSSGNFGGLTLDNWRFLTGEIRGFNVNIWQITLNSLTIAVFMTVVILIVASMAGYALSRMNFKGRRTFLSFTLILHGFPAVTLIIPIFLVLINLGNLPIIGQFIGFNTPGGIALVMVAFELPLGVWLMKGFFDNISWDMERSALIDGATRWRTFREIILPQIRPGLLALGIFSFIAGWNAYLLPATYSIGTGTINLPVYIRQITGELSPVNWNQVAAVGLFQLIPIFVFFIFAQEYLLNIYAGGTKGSS